MTTTASTEAPAGRSSILRSSAVMAAGTMVSRVLGLVRTILLTTILGATTGVGNAFATANTLPNMVFILLAGGVLNAVLVPQMARALKQEDGGKGYTDRLLTLAMSILLIVTIVFTIAAPLAYFTLDVSGATPTTLGIAFTYICLPQILFYGIYTLLGEALNARGRFGAFMWSPVLANVVSIAGLIWFWMGTTPAEVADPTRWTWKMVAVLAGSATLGIVAQALVLIIPLRRAGYSFRPNFHFRGVGLRTASTVAIWAFAAVIVQQFGLVVTTNVLNAVPSGYGGTLAQQNAFLLFMLPHSIVTISLVTALYTRLSHAAADGRTDDVKADLDTGLRLSGLASVGVTIGAFALAHPVSKAMFGEVSGPAIGDMTIALMLGLVPFTVCVLVQRVFYAYSDAKTPFWMQVGCTAVAVVLTLGAVALPPRWIGPGVGFAASMSYIADGALGWYLLRRRIGRIPVRSAVRGYVQLGVAALVATIVAAAIRFGLQSVIGDTGRVVNMVITVAAGVPFLIVYMLVARRLGVQEITQLLNPVLSRLPGGRRTASAPTPSKPAADAAAPGTEVSREPHAPQSQEIPEFGVAEPGELAIGDPHQSADAVRPVAPLPGRTHTAPPTFDFWDADHTMAVPSLGEGVLADTAPIPLRVRLPQSRRPVTMPVEPDAAPEPRRVPDDSAENLRLASGAAEEASAPETVGHASTTTEGEPFVQGIESGHELAGRYLLRQLIASTDDKQVWQATDQTLSRDVTATVFPTSAPHSAAALDSARRAAAVEDRHMPRVLDVGSQDDASYVIHEQLTGAESIASMLQFDRLPAEEARRMVGEAASALHAAAARGLHHLALTPHEIVRGRDGSVYVQGMATDAALIGADELSSAEASRADARALTEVLYAALTGRWAGEDEVPGVEPAIRDAAGNVSPVSSLRRNAPGDLSALCQAVLNEDAGPRTPGELAAQLAPWSSEQVAADAPAAPEKPGSKTDDLGGPAAAAAAAGAGGAAGVASLRTDDRALGAHAGADPDADPDATEHIPVPPSDPDATQTFDATAPTPAPRRDDYDPSFSDLEPPLPRMSAGADDPDSDTSKLALAIVAAFLVAALVLGIIGLRGLFTSGGDSGASRSTVVTQSGQAPGGSSGSSASPSSSTVAPGQKLPVASIVSFDPQGDGDEHTDWAPRAIDGNPDSMWMTHIYGRADYMGGRKKGSGLLLDLGKSTQVGSVKINTPGNPSTIQVFVTDNKTIEGATPFGEMIDKSGEQTVTGKAPATGRYVILWVTQLSKGNLGGYRQKIAEVEVLS